MTVTVLGYFISISIEFYDVFNHISKYLEVSQKYSATRRIFNSLLSVWKCSQYGFSCFKYYVNSHEFF